MITTFLIAHPWLTTVALVALVVLGPIAGALLAPRPRVAWWLAALSLVPVAVLTLVPVDSYTLVRCAREWTPVPSLGQVELIANVVLFVPPVLLAGVASRRPLLAALAGSLLSVAVEALQAGLPAIGRSCSTNDWWSNTLGAVLGALLAWVALRIASARTARAARAA